MIGSSTAFTAFRERLDQVAATRASVLLVGESGSGKGRAARYLHAQSPDPGPYVEVSLAALAPSLIEAELFGHEAGAFTGADRARSGRFRQADGGTLVLDDVDVLPFEIQVKLLRVLQERLVEPLGAEEAVPVDLRVVATTQRDLMSEVEAGSFRRDLYYRLAVVVLDVPPLRARLDDLSELCAGIVERLAGDHGLAPRAVGEDALVRLGEHSWPGNVRELENALERAMVLAGTERPDGSPLCTEDLGFLGESAMGLAEDLATRALAAGLSVADLERALLDRALEENRGNLSAAARQVGLTRRAAEYRLARRDESTDASDTGART